MALLGVEVSTLLSTAFDIEGARENIRQLSTGWSNDLLTQMRDRARLASLGGIGPPWPAGPSQSGRRAVNLQESFSSCSKRILSPHGMEWI